MAACSAKDRGDFIANLTNGVAAFINEAAQDRAGAQAIFFGTAASKKKNSIPSIAIRVIDEAVKGADEGPVGQHHAQGDVPSVQPASMPTDAPPSAPAEAAAPSSASVEAAAGGHSDAKEHPKPKRKTKGD
jgi:hypothetical protein